MGRRAAIVPAPVQLDLVDLGGINGKDIAKFAADTLRTGESLLKHWKELEPIVKRLTVLVKDEVDNSTVDNPTMTLSLVAGVVEKISRASASLMKASEGLGRLTLLVMGGVPKRPDTRQLSEKQLANVVVETCKRMFKEQGVCPVCAPPPIEVGTA